MTRIHETENPQTEATNKIPLDNLIPTHPEYVAIKAKLAIATEALRFYATATHNFQEENAEGDLIPGSCELDEGETARAALAKIQEEK